MQAAPLNGNLTAPLVPIIGRDTDLERVVTLLLEPNTRLLTLTGPAGVGKTSLALEVARAAHGMFPDGVWFVDLSATREANAVLIHVARACGLRDSAASARTVLTSFLRESSTLLVLDNLEQIPEVGVCVAELLGAVESVRVLATSRQALHLRTERRYPVRPLTLPKNASKLEQLEGNPSVALFLARAREINPDYRLTNDNAPVIAQLCARLDGLPLALELAASRTDVVSPATILARLEAHDAVPTISASDTPERHRSLQAALDWGFDLLDDAHKTLFRKLGAFSGTFDAESASVVADTASLGLDALMGLALLADHNLLVPLPGGKARFRMLVTVRDYALERLQAAGESPAVRSKHAEHFLELSQTLARHIHQPQVTTAVERFDLERENIDEALRWLFQHAATDDARRSALCLTVSRRHYWRMTGQWNEAQRWYRTALEHAGDANVDLRSKVMAYMAVNAISWMDFPAAQTLVNDALSLSRTLETDRLTGEILLTLALFHESRGEVKLAQPIVVEALEIARKHGDQSEIATALIMLASLAFRDGRLDEAEGIWNESIELLRQTDDLRAIAGCLNNLAALSYQRGDLKGAQLRLEEALELCEQIKDGYWSAIISGNLGINLVQLGDFDRAETRLEEALERLRQISHLNLRLMNVLYHLGSLDVKRGRIRLGIERLLEFMSNSHDIESIVDGAHCLATRLVSRGRAENAAALLGAARHLLETQAVTLDASDQAEVDATHVTVRAALDPETFQRQWTRGLQTPLHTLFEEIRDTISEEPVPASPSSSLERDPPSLSARELEVLLLVTRGLSNKVIARELEVSPHTVKFHLTSVFNKLGCNSRAEAVRIGIERGLL
jgi:predicted ATPase/DNA-binding CsgD family transcriptional regulator